MDVDEICWAKIGKYLLFVAGLVAVCLAWDQSDDLSNVLLRAALAVWGLFLIAISFFATSVTAKARDLDKASSK